MENKNTIDNSIFYNSNKLFSYDAIYNFAMGERGAGKTFQGKKRMIENFIRKKEQSIYVRRRGTELDKIKDDLFKDMEEHYPQLEIKVKGYCGYINDEIFCYFIALSSSNDYKSKSMPNVSFIFFDEYVLTKNGHSRYLKNEMVALNDLVETVFRLRPPKVYMCSNAVSYVNPFFTFFNIQPKPNDRFITIKEDGENYVVLELTKNAKYMEVKKQSKFARMLQHTSYGKYAFDNELLEDNNDFILKDKPKDFNFFRGAYRIGNEIVGCWSHCKSDMGIWLGENYDKNSSWKYTIYNEEVYEKWKNIKIDRNNWNIKYIKNSFLDGKAFYENQNIKKLFTEQISKYL